MLLTFKDFVSGQPVAVNPSQVTVVFVSTQEPYEGKVVVTLLNGSIVVDEKDFVTVVEELNYELD